MFASLAAALVFVAATTASPLAKREFDPQSVCNEMTAQEGHCHFVMTTGMKVRLGGSPAVGTNNGISIGYGGSAGGSGSLYDSGCNLMESGDFKPQSPGFKLEFMETMAHDWIEAFQPSMGQAFGGIPIPSMKSGLNDPLTPICGEERSTPREGLNVGSYRVCVFDCSGGRQLKEEDFVFENGPGSIAGSDEVFGP